MTLTKDVEKELGNQSDRNVFDFWRDEIINLYVSRRIRPDWEVIRRALRRSNLVDFVNSRYFWSDRGIKLIEKELNRRGLVIERHKSLFRKVKNISMTEVRSDFSR
jgi:hypothetical protein